MTGQSEGKGEGIKLIAHPATLQRQPPGYRLDRGTIKEPCASSLHWLEMYFRSYLGAAYTRLKGGARGGLAHRVRRSLLVLDARLPENWHRSFAF